MSRQTRASVNTCIVLVVSSAGSEGAIFDTAARGDGVDERCDYLPLQCCSALAEALTRRRATGEVMQRLQSDVIHKCRFQGVSARFKSSALRAAQTALHRFARGWR